MRLSRFTQTLQYAAEKHQYQRRAGYDALPYINHLIKVSHLLIQAGEMDPDLLCAAILHDVLEDTDATFEELSTLFGEKVAHIVQELTDDMSLPYATRKQLQLYRITSLSPMAQKIRIADKACNIQDIFHYPLDWTPDKKRAYLENSIAIIDQIRDEYPALISFFDQEVQKAQLILAQT